MNLANLSFKKNNETGILRLNRPEALNALNTATFHDMNTVLDKIESSPDVSVVIVTGEGKAFVAGADIAEMKDMDGEQSRQFSLLGQKTFRRIEQMETVFIAAVNGYALGGGCELAMACDLRVASEKAKFGQPEVNLGVVPGFAATQRLTRLVGPSKAKELLFTADIIDADTALGIGLVNRVVAPETLFDEVIKLAAQIQQKGPLAVRLVKSCVNRAMDADMETGSAFEAEAFGLCFASGETREGMSAFLEKREAKFKK